MTMNCSTLVKSIFFTIMGKTYTQAQLEKIEGGRRYVKSSTNEDKEVLYYAVVNIGPSLFGSLINSNSDTVWSRVEDPTSFKYEEMEKYAEVFHITLERFQEIMRNQREFNAEARKAGLPIGREKYKQIRS